MQPNLIRACVGTVLGMAGALATMPPPVRAAAEITRTVYLSAVGATGAVVTDLTPADIVVKENGQARQVTQLGPATALAHVAVLVDDGGNGLMQSAVARLAASMTGRANFSISMLNPQPLRLNDFTGDFDVLRTSIGKIVQRGRPPRDPLQLVEAIGWAARDLRKRELRRPVIVAFTNGGESDSIDIARDIVNDLQQSEASLHLVYVGGVPMGQVLIDGPTQSGGSSSLANSTQAFMQAAAAIAATLANQYRLSYVLPDGVKPHARLQVTTTRPDVRIAAPTRISDR